VKIDQEISLLLEVDGAKGYPRNDKGRLHLTLTVFRAGCDSFLKFGSFSAAGLAKQLSSLGYSSGPLRRNQRVRPHRLYSCGMRARM
jgi:hypothetical protein